MCVHVHIYMYSHFHTKPQIVVDPVCLSHGLSFIRAWISNPIPGKVWDEITNQFSNFNCVSVGVWERISNFTPLFIMVVVCLLIHPGLKLTSVSVLDRFLVLKKDNNITAVRGAKLPNVLVIERQAPGKWDSTGFKFNTSFGQMSCTRWVTHSPTLGLT